MLRYSKYYLLLLLFFALDKIFLLPAIKLKFTNAAAANPYTETLEDEDPAPANPGKHRTVWVFGSSRSMPFLRLPVDAHTRTDRFTSEEEKRLLLDTDIRCFAFPAANPYLLLTRFQQLLDRGLRADMVAVEISPSYFNANRSINNVIAMEGIPLKTGLRHPESFPYDMRKDLLLSRLFASYRYKVDFIGLLTWSPRKEAKLFEKVGGNTVFQQAEEGRHRREDRVFREEEWGDLPVEGGDPGKRMQRFDLFTAFHEQTYFTNWRTDPRLIEALAAMAAAGKKAGVPTVFFKVRLPPIMLDLKKKYGYDGEIEPKLRDALSRNDGIYLDLNRPGYMKCAYFTDASHLSPRCFTEFGARLIETGLPTLLDTGHRADSHAPPR